MIHRGEHRPVGLVGLAGLNKNKVAVDAARIDALPIGERLRVSFNELAFETSLLSKTSLLLLLLLLLLRRFHPRVGPVFLPARNCPFFSSLLGCLLRRESRIN